MLDDADEQKLAPMTAFRRRGPAQSTKEPTALRPWAILGALALGRIAFGYQFQTVATLGSDLVPLFHLSYAEFGALIGAYMLLGAFVALPLGVLGRWFGDRTGCWRSRAALKPSWRAATWARAPWCSTT